MIKRGWFFDVDGVIANLKTRKVKFLEILRKIKQILREGEPVLLITGRPVSWVDKEVLSLLKVKENEKKILDRLRLYGEFGGSLIYYKNGVKKTLVYRKYAIDQKSRLELIKKINTSYSRSMFLDESKLIVATAERKKGVMITTFNQDAKKLIRYLRGFNSEVLNSRFRIGSTHTSVDFLDKRLGKSFCVRQALVWLKQKKIKVKEFVVIGDSSYDLELAEELYSQKKKLKFVFVGKRSGLEKKAVPFPIIYTKRLYDAGALEFLVESLSGV